MYFRAHGALYLAGVIDCFTFVTMWLVVVNKSRDIYKVSGSKSIWAKYRTDYILQCKPFYFSDSKVWSFNNSN